MSAPSPVGFGLYFIDVLACLLFCLTMALVGARFGREQTVAVDLPRIERSDRSGPDLASRTISLRSEGEQLEVFLGEARVSLEELEARLRSEPPPSVVVRAEGVVAGTGDRDCAWRGRSRHPAGVRGGGLPMIRMIFVVAAAFAVIVAAARWVERNGLEPPVAAVTPAVRTVQLAANALRATLQPRPQVMDEAEDRPQAPVSPEAGPEIVVEVEIAADHAAPFVEVVPGDEPPASVGTAVPDAVEPSHATLERIDPNTSAALVRRMLTVYERMRSGG